MTADVGIAAIEPLQVEWGDSDSRRAGGGDNRSTNAPLGLAMATARGMTLTAVAATVRFALTN